MAVAPRTPGGVMLEDGYQTVITFALDEDIALWEKTVTPPGMEGGEKVSITTMHNREVMTYAPRSLKEVTDSQMTVAYDPAVLTSILALINIPGKITITFPDLSTWAFDGYLKNFQPGSIQEGTQPEATCTIVATNRDTSLVDPLDPEGPPLDEPTLAEIVPQYGAPPAPEV